LGFFSVLYVCGHQVAVSVFVVCPSESNLRSISLIFTSFTWFVAFFPPRYFRRGLIPPATRSHFVFNNDPASNVLPNCHFPPLRILLSQGLPSPPNRACFLLPSSVLRPCGLSVKFCQVPNICLYKELFSLFKQV